MKKIPWDNSAQHIKLQSSAALACTPADKTFTPRCTYDTIYTKEHPSLPSQAHTTYHALFRYAYESASFGWL